MTLDLNTRADAAFDRAGVVAAMLDGTVGTYVIGEVRARLTKADMPVTHADLVALVVEQVDAALVEVGDLDALVDADSACIDPAALRFVLVQFGEQFIRARDLRNRAKAENMK